MGRDIYRRISSYVKLQLTVLSSVLQLMVYATILNINQGIALFPLQLLFAKFFVIITVVIGFIGDEVGLLLTFGDYYSDLTTDFFVAAIAFVLLVTLFLRYRKQIDFDVLRLHTPERLTQVGVFLIGFSILTFAFGAPELGIPLIVAGILLGAFARRRSVAGTAPTGDE